MPTPVAHTLAGAAVALFLPNPPAHISGSIPKPRADGRERLFVLALVLFAANAPDLDFVPGLLTGRPAIFHAGITHSLGFALGFSLVAAGISSLKTKAFFSTFLLIIAAYLSHLLLDYLNPDGRPPYGIPFWWPLSEVYFIASTPVFLGVHHSGSGFGTTLEFVRSVLNLANLRAMVVESLILAPFVLLGAWVERVRRQSAERDLETEQKPATLEEGE